MEPVRRGASHWTGQSPWARQASHSDSLHCGRECGRCKSFLQFFYVSRCGSRLPLTYPEIYSEPSEAEERACDCWLRRRLECLTKSARAHNGVSLCGKNRTIFIFGCPYVTTVERHAGSQANWQKTNHFTSSCLKTS